MELLIAVALSVGQRWAAKLLLQHWYKLSHKLLPVFLFYFLGMRFFFVVFIVVVIRSRKIISEQRCAYQRVNILCRDFTVICGESEYNCKFNWRKLLSRQFVAYCISAVVQKI